MLPSAVCLPMPGATRAVRQAPSRPRLAARAYPPSARPHNQNRPQEWSGFVADLVQKEQLSTGVRWLRVAPIGHDHRLLTWIAGYWNADGALDSAARLVQVW